MILCRICLRPGIEKNMDIDQRLIDIHEELCVNDDIFDSYDLSYCSICEYQLRKCYNFRQKCRRGHEILKTCKIKAATHDTVIIVPLEINEKLSVTPTQYMCIGDYPPTESTPQLTFKKEDTDGIVVMQEVTYETQYIEELQSLVEDTEIINDLNNSELHTDNEDYAENEIIDKQLFFCCDVCNRNFLNSYELEIHLNVHTKNKKYICNRCDKAFKQNGHLIEHMRIHTGEKPYKCNRCDKAFNRKDTLKKHMLIHTGEKPYSCNTCDKAFIQKVQLKSHMRIHTGEIPYSCNRCGKAFNQKEHLKEHMRIHTGERPYSCNQCDKAFNQNGNLKQHMRIHTGEKPYSCKRCDKAFNLNDTLKKHMRIHTGEKPYSCNSCNKAFNQKVRLKKHMQIHVKESQTVAKRNFHKKKV